MKKDYTDYYSELLYELLPEIYRKKDYETNNKELKRFLSIIGEQAGVLRQNMDELWYDFFIETCHDWVVPYIGDLLGTNLVFNDAARNRVDVKKTIFWRRRKGTVFGLEDMTKGITGWEVRAVEFFEKLNWSQNMNLIKPDKHFTPDLKNIYQFENLNSALDTIQHTVDVSSPSWRQGWYNIKNMGFFLYTKNVYRLDHVVPSGISSGKYTFSPIGKDVKLFDNETGDLIKPLHFKEDPGNYFGNERGMSIFCDGIPAAQALPASTAPVLSEKKCRIGELLDTGEPGIQIMDWTDKKGKFKIEAIEVEWDGSKYVGPKLWGALTTSDMNYVKSGIGSQINDFMLKISLEAGADAALFPMSILALRGKGEKIAQDTRESVYSNALYVYLPEIFLKTGDELYLFVNDVGATYFTRDGINKTGKPSIQPDKAFDIKGIARGSNGQVYPPGSLSNSMKPLTLDDKNNDVSLELFEINRFTGKDFSITFAIVDDNKLVLIIKHVSGDRRFPQCELVFKNSQGKGVLIYLPEVNFKNDKEYIYLYPADDGSTYYTNNTVGHAGDPVLRPDTGGAFSIDLIARKSAGQVLPIPDAFPLQQREVEYLDLCNWKHAKFKEPSAGTLAIDPVLGRFCFPPGEVPDGAITVKYNDAFTHDVGAWTYDRRTGLRDLTQSVKNGDELSKAMNDASENEVIQIDNSLTYTGPFEINNSMTIQAANFQRPTFYGKIIIEYSIGELRLDGIFFTREDETEDETPLISVTAHISKLIIANCTFNPQKICIEVSGSGSIDSIEVSKSVIGKIICKKANEIKITDSIVENKAGTAIGGDADTEKSDAILMVDRSTILGDCRVKELFSSDSIHTGIIDVINTQQGCIRYSRYQEKDSRLPRVFNSIQDIPLFNSRSFWKFDYCELSQNSSEKIKTRSENGSEMGAFSGAQNPLREKNMIIKLQEYMPLGLRPVIIYEL